MKTETSLRSSTDSLNKKPTSSQNYGHQSYTQAQTNRPQSNTQYQINSSPNSSNISKNNTQNNVKPQNMRTIKLVFL